MVRRDETLIPMMLRISVLPAMLAGVALAVFPAAGQSRGSNFMDTQQSPYHGQVVEEIIANVNDQVISKSDYDRALQELEQEARQQGWTQAQLYQQRKDLLRSLIDNQLLLSKGKELGITGETETIRRLDEMRKQYHLDSMEALQKAAEEQGVSFEDLKEQIRENVIRSEVISQEVGSRIMVAPSEIAAYYKAHPEEFERPESVQLSEILIATPNPDDAAQVAEAEKKADDIEARLKTGADFATVAKADSNGPTASDGGKLGDFKRGDLAKVLEEATFGLKAGQFTEPIRTRQGWLIMEVTAHQQAGIAPLDEVQNQIQEKIGYAKMEPALRVYLSELRDQAYIDVRPRYVDSGATGHEQKFLMGAYQPPQPKHKKTAHEERTRFREKAPRQKKETDAAGAAPAGVPTLDKINGTKNAGKEVASARTQKPGKREKIRFGQAPRETLPVADTRDVDAGAGAATTNVAANNQPGNAVVTNAAGDVIDTGNQAEKKTKTRFADRPKKTKEDKQKEKVAKKNRFAPPKETPAELAQDKLDQQAMGLNGDTTKPKKKPNPAKTGPKRRMSDQDKDKGQAQPNGQNGTGSSGAGQTPQGSNPNPNGTANQGAAPPQ
jgi:peptidyl-prolyl cis-trans isomerase SurA